MTDLGFYTGPIDGVWTEELTQAIQALQAELGVPQTGVLDAATLRAIYAAGQDSGAATTTTVPATTAPETTSPETTAPTTTRRRPPGDDGDHDDGTARPRHRRRRFRRSTRPCPR
jgi:peptidoglycan hydrolase-like protein with peptidoglycan-binding domain